MNFKKLFFVGCLIILQLTVFVRAQDWLIDASPYKAAITQKGNTVELNNGLVRRKFTIGANFACTDYTNLTNQQQLLRAIKPEARVVLDGILYNVGGLVGQKENGYILPGLADTLKAAANDFKYVSHKIAPLKPFLNWKNKSWAHHTAAPTGQALIVTYAHPSQKLNGIKVEVHYELYNHLPLIVKWVSILNSSNTPHALDRVVNEVLGLVEEDSSVV